MRKLPNRILRDGIIESERVNQLSPGAELFYRRLMSKADDFGRFHGNPALILAACYPLQLDRVSLTNVREWLTECGQSPPLVREYSDQNKNYIEIINFGQRTRSTTSKFPDPPLTIDGGVRTIVRESRASAAECGSRASSPSPSPSPKDASERPENPHRIAEEVRKHELVEAIVRGLANEQPDPQDFEAGVDAAIREILSSANPEITVKTMKENLPQWWAAMREGRARVKPMRFVIVDRDYLRVPAAKNGKVAPKSRNQQIQEEMEAEIAKL